jgi:hypothetical protein
MPRSAERLALEVMDALLGGAFASRITANIREQKGTPIRRSVRSIRTRPSPAGSKRRT